MGKTTKKIVFTSLKVAIAAALMAWVFSKVSWNDYAIDAATKKPFAIVGQEIQDSSTVTVASGMLWWRQEYPARPVKDFVRTDQTKQGPVIQAKTLAEVRLPGFATSIRNINVMLLTIGGLGFGVSMLIVAVRWWFLLRLQDIHISLWEAVRLTFLGQFFNQVMPSTVGGDLVKAYYVAKHTPKKAAVLVSVFVDRILGLTELTFLAAVMVGIVLVTGMESFDSVRTAVIAVLIVVGIVTFAMIFLLSNRFRQLFRLEKFYQRLPIAHHFAAAGDAARLYSHRLPALLKAIGVTVGAQVIWIVSIFLLGLSVALPIHWHHYFTYIPLIYIIGSIPAAPGGVGLVEGAYVEFFKMVNPSQILVLAMLARIFPVVWGLPGIIVAVTGPKLPKAEEMEAELENEIVEKGPDESSPKA